MTTWREVERRPLYPVLTDQNQRAATVSWNRGKENIVQECYRKKKKKIRKSAIKMIIYQTVCESSTILTALVTVNTDDLPQRNSQRVVPVDTVTEEEVWS